MPKSAEHPNEWPIRALRISRGLSLNELSAQTGIDPAHLELIERDSASAAPTIAELQKVADALGCTIEDIRGSLKS